ncbi:MAG: hypothetical protein AB7G24_07225 [Novosphingobium sp.]
MTDAEFEAEKAALLNGHSGELSSGHDIAGPSDGTPAAGQIFLLLLFVASIVAAAVFIFNWSNDQITWAEIESEFPGEFAVCDGAVREQGGFKCDSISTIATDRTALTYEQIIGHRFVTKESPEEVLSWDECSSISEYLSDQTVDGPDSSTIAYSLRQALYQKLLPLAFEQLSPGSRQICGKLKNEGWIDLGAGRAMEIEFTTSLEGAGKADEIMKGTTIIADDASNFTLSEIWDGETRDGYVALMRDLLPQEVASEIEEGKSSLFVQSPLAALALLSVDTRYGVQSAFEKCFPGILQMTSDDLVTKLYVSHFARKNFLTTAEDKAPLGLLGLCMYGYLND